MRISFAKLGNEQCEACLVYEMHNETKCTDSSCEVCKNQQLHLKKAQVDII